MVQEKKKTGVIIAIVIISLLIIGLGGYLVYDRILNKEDIPQEENPTRTLTDSNIINALKDRLSSYQFYTTNEEKFPGMIREAAEHIYFSDDFMIAHAIYALMEDQDKYVPDVGDGHTITEIPFVDIETFIKDNFVVSSFEYEGFDINGLYADQMKFSSSDNAFIHNQLHTGGLFTGLLPLNNINPLKFEQTNDFYIVTATFVTTVQSGEEYFCSEALERPDFKEKIHTKIFNSLDFGSIILDQESEIECIINEEEGLNFDQITKNVREKLEYDRIIKDAPQYRFIFTKEGNKFVRIEKV